MIGIEITMAAVVVFWIVAIAFMVWIERRASKRLDREIKEVEAQFIATCARFTEQAHDIRAVLEEHLE